MVLSQQPVAVLPVPHLAEAPVVERCPVLIAADKPGLGPLLELFGHASLETWEPLVATTVEQAHFVLQHGGVEVAVVEGSLYRAEDWPDLDRLTPERPVAALLLAELDPPDVAKALAAGFLQWLAPSRVLGHPELLAAALRRCLEVVRSRQAASPRDRALADCRLHVSRLVNLLWEAAPIDGRPRWWTQRHILERLQEEMARAERHGTPLSVAIGEVHPTGPAAPAGAELDAWAAERVLRAKRRADVAGRYGPHGFLLLMTNTQEPGAEVCCRRLQQALEQAEGNAGVRTYFGFATFSGEPSSVQQLLSRAEQELDRAKGRGSND